MENLKNIRNVIFDLGGVLFTLSGQATLDAFENCGVKNINQKYKEMIDSEWFRDFEIGNIPAEIFRENMKKLMDINFDDETFDKCWNAMITGYPSENQTFLTKMSEHFNLYILSNTNVIHVDYFEPIAKWNDKIFKKRYYSNEIHFRKPDLECFKFVIDDAHINPSETLFIDDRADNIEGAKRICLNTIHLTQQNDLYGYFKDFTK